MELLETKSQIKSEALLGVIQIASFCAAKGWVPATSGNFSTRVDLKSIAITVSGTDKSQLTPADIQFIDYQGHSLETDKRPSAESLLHTQLYSTYPEIQAIAHIHSTTSTVLSKILFEQGKDEIVLENLELLKALSGVNTHQHREVIPIFENNQFMLELVQEIDLFLENKPMDQSFHAYLIAGHGLYTWGKSAKEVIVHVEAISALLDSNILETKVKGV